MSKALYFVGGWSPDAPDDRDLDYPSELLKAPTELPRSKVLQMRMPPIYNQKALGSCTAQAARRVVQFTEKEQVGFKTKRPVPSALFIYWNTRNLMGTADHDSGATIRETFKALAKWGYCSERYWPYTISRFAEQPSDEAYFRAAPHMLKDTNYYRVCREDQDESTKLRLLKSALVEENPPAFGATLKDSFARAAQSGIVPVPSRNEDVVGGHAMVIVGYDDDREAFLIDNSWGTGWGLNGRAWWPYEYMLSRLCRDFWTLRGVPAVSP